MFGNSGGSGREVVIRRREVDVDVALTETEVRMSDSDFDFDLSDFESDLSEKMDGAESDVDSDSDAARDEDPTDVAIREMVEEESDSKDTEPDQDGDGGGGEGDEPEQQQPLSAEEAADMWDTWSRQAFNSDCLSAEPEPQLDMGECSSLWSEIDDLGLREEPPENPDDADDADGGGEDGGDGSASEMASQMDLDIDPDSVQDAYLVIEGGTDVGESARAQFEDFIEGGTLMVAEYFNSPVAQDIKSELDEEIEPPELVLETEDGFHVA